jgi:predicted transcriptional regulator
MSIDPNVPLGMTRDIVIAEVSNNHVPPEALPGLIQQVYDTLCRIAADAMARRGATPLVAAPAESPEATATSARPAPEETPAAVAEAEAASDGRRGRTAREDGLASAVPRDKSVFPEHIVCLFDGVKRKMLKRHIRSRYGMSPEAYRQYWELADDYPMVAPNYSNEKREYAIQTEFGVPRGRRRKNGTRAA